uniref:Uncharacterized protein n=1 Tax=Meloidogyne javanica TaxID=6303 RepID=A0A915MRE4_MELJA
MRTQIDKLRLRQTTPEKTQQRPMDEKYMSILDKDIMMEENNASKKVDKKKIFTTDVVKECHEATRNFIKELLPMIHDSIIEQIGKIVKENLKKIETIQLDQSESIVNLVATLDEINNNNEIKNLSLEESPAREENIVKVIENKNNKEKSIIKENNQVEMPSASNWRGNHGRRNGRNFYNKERFRHDARHSACNCHYENFHGRRGRSYRGRN